MEYLLKVTAVVTIFYTIYKLFLQRDTFFESNRWFLIIGLISSLLIPFLVIPIYIDYTPISFTNITVTEQLSNEAFEKPFNILDYLPLIYGLGVVFFLGRFCIQLLSLMKIIYKNKGIKKDRFVFIETQNNTSPFSFFKWIVYNPETFSQTELEHIIEHEKTHAKQYHSIDILVTQLFSILLWFNPFMWLYNKDLKQNLEFIADKRTLKQYNCKKSYQYTLLKTSMPFHQMALSNHFYNSLIKKRIVMLHKSKSKKINQLKYALVIPILALFLMGFNTKEVYVNQETSSSESNLISKSPINTNEPFIFYILDGVSNEEFQQIESELQKRGYEIKISDLKRNKFELITGITLNISNEITSSDFSTTSNIPIKPIKVVLDSSGNSINIGVASEKVVMGFPSQEKANAYKKTKTIKNLFSDGDERTPLFIVDGKQITEEEAEGLSSDNVQSVNVLNDANATKKYGDKGKNGVLEITTKWETNFIVGKAFDAQATEDTLNRIRMRGSETPLYIVNGKEVTEDIVKALNPDNIESFNVLKDEKYTIIYGEKGKNGVVMITTKMDTNFKVGTALNSETSNTPKTEQTTPWKVETVRNNVVFASSDTLYVNRNDNVVKDNSSVKNLKGNPLYIINGEVSSKKTAENLDQLKISSVRVFKGEEYTKKYGSKAKDGVVIIETTNENPYKHIIKINTSILYIVNGKELSQKEFEKLNPETFDSVHVLKKETAKKKYGENAKNGVVEISTKK